MSNMSYCRFHNTLSDLEDCKDVLDSGEGITTVNEYKDKLSDTEIDKAIELLEMCREIAENFENIDLNDLRDTWENLKTEN